MNSKAFLTAHWEILSSLKLHKIMPKVRSDALTGTKKNVRLLDVATGTSPDGT